MDAFATFADINALSVSDDIMLADPARAATAGDVALSSLEEIALEAPLNYDAELPATCTLFLPPPKFHLQKLIDLRPCTFFSREAPILRRSLNMQTFDFPAEHRLLYVHITARQLRPITTCLVPMYCYPPSIPRPPPTYDIRHVITILDIHARHTPSPAAGTLGIHPATHPLD
ncbi:hypothetical protein FISHEDRAFT_69706 [Fistulina hepatica ATCC 64428]|uniref:Uncharacterized protein n=1 Tax=Fistulina hepatica ATCC 64428 TaxID=1128425 RepID=A0A0D7AMS1_9AGAR|nr:hypothetical protein FISHEDRAFT_69706 [Fistulina hepatica ATCC 64428]